MDAYGAVKATMTHYMKTLSKKLIPKKIRVNTVSPGDTFFEGGFWDTVKQNQFDMYEQTVLANPMGRLCTPEEVANVVVFVSSPMASFVSGDNWLVDGAATNHIQI
jgi:NAD(P)-dependent dehydrogenase (short-subunit alcohol dehydrogenase family)